jgi:hypothetical protein
VASQHLLFRQEAVDFQQHNRQWGQVALLQPLSTKIIAWLVAASVALVVVFLFLAQYARKETVLGYLTPPAGTAKVGKLRALAVTTTTRSDVLPEVPALRDTLPDYEASAWFGIGAPKNTPTELIERLNKEVNISIADPKLEARLANLAGTVLSGSPADFGKLISDETNKSGKVVVAANIKSN